MQNLSVLLDCGCGCVEGGCEFREFWAREEPRDLKEHEEITEIKKLTKPEQRTEPEYLMYPIEHTELNSHPYASSRTNADTRPRHPPCHTYTQIETITCTNTLTHRTRSNE